jgi:uncharacterized protein (DUF924 family)
MIEAGDDQLLPPLQRAFVYLPLEHAEDMAMQEQAVALFTRRSKARAAIRAWPACSISPSAIAR